MKTYIIRKKNPLSVYCGSLIQQNHGEDLNGHGYVIWNLKTKAFKQVDIHNEYGFYTIDINRGKLVTDIKDIPSKVRLRVKCFETIASEVKSVISEIKKLTEIIEVTYVRVDSEQKVDQNKLSQKDLNLSELSSVEYQNKLIRSFLTNKFSKQSIDEDMFSRVFKINKLYNESIDKDKIVRNIRWKPKKFEFSNMFSYGEDNVIDFTNMKDVVGIFAVNASGKSSILSALSFCIFDKCDRAFKASHVLNSQKMSFSCKFNFEIDGVDFFIKRIGTADKKGNVKVDVKFWKLVNGKVVELNGEARRSTNDLIRDYLGTYEDFILTVLSIQNNKLGTFVDMGQSERKDLLSQFMGLNLFDELNKPATEKLKELEMEVKFLQKNQSAEDISDIEAKILTYSNKCKELSEEKDSLNVNREKLNNTVIELTEKLVKLDEDIPTDIQNFVKKREVLFSDIIESESSVKVLEESLVEVKNKLMLSETALSKFSPKLESDYEAFLSLKKSLSSKKHEIDKKKIFVEGKLEKIRRLENHQYDPNCKFCVNNDFVKDALVAKESLKQDKIDSEKLISEYTDINLKVSSLAYIESEYNSYKSLLPEISSFEKIVAQKSKQILTLQNKIVVDKNSLKDVETIIEKYKKQESDIKSNLKIESDRRDVTRQIQLADKLINEKTSELTNFSSKIETLNIEKKKRKENEALLSSLELDIQAYTYYVSAVSRDGIPFELISKAVPVIEKEVNTILSQIVEFGVRIQTDGKNVVTHIVYNDKSWPLELASGLEKFLTSLVIRVALINISNLPRPNFIAIDEGFGCADADNLSSMNPLFSILKDKFDFMFIISHLDSMKDMVDHTLEIKKEHGFSKITM